MATTIPSQQDLYDDFKNEVQARAPELTDFEEGSNLDALGGAVSVAGQEVLRVIVDLFAKTYFSTANGPEVTGGPDDLQTLAVDHFGDGFARPAATPAVGTVTFSRPGSSPNVLIPAGTIVKTNKDASGNEQRFATLINETITGTSINASVQAVVAGLAGNVNANTIVKIESALPDSTIVVTNPATLSGGAEQLNDADYREFIRLKIETLRGATKAAIEAAAKTVSGIITATAIENLQAVIEWDIGGSVTVGSFFYIPRVKLYVADANGAASDALIALVIAAVEPVRACGVRVEVVAATGLPVNWSATITFNPSGPNFAVLSLDPTLIEQNMAQYIRDLPIGTGFDRDLAKAYIMSVWGPAGTNDITDFITSVPSGNISATATQKLIPGTIEAD